MVHRLLRVFLFPLLSGLIAFSAYGQQVDLGLKNYMTSVPSPYRLDLKNDLIVSGASLALIGTGYWLKGFRTPLTVEDITGQENLDAIEKIPSFDVSAIHQFTDDFVAASDALLFTSMAMPFIAFADKRVNGHALQIIAMYFETLAVAEAFHTMSTSISNRRRPYTFNTDSIAVFNAETGQTELQPEVTEDYKLKAGNVNSFFSGHTSTAAAATFFGARVFTDFRPHSKLVPYVWAAAAVVPAFTGYSRYRAGRHFPTDVITGYLVGASVGVLVPTLHRFKGNNLSLLPAYEGAGFAMNYTF